LKTQKQLFKKFLFHTNKNSKITQLKIIFYQKRHGKVKFWSKMAIGAIRAKLFFQLFS
jgi:hypothetical protein